VQQKGFFGQGVLFNEPNTYPIPTMYKFCASGARYFTDSDTEAWRIVDGALEFVAQDQIFKYEKIIPLRRMGEGCSRLRELAPGLYLHLKARLYDIGSKNLEWNYNYE